MVCYVVVFALEAAHVPSDVKLAPAANLRSRALRKIVPLRTAPGILALYLLDTSLALDPSNHWQNGTNIWQFAVDCVVGLAFVVVMQAMWDHIWVQVVFN